MGDTIQLQGTAEIPAKLKWSNSANILCNYMRELEYLEIILKNKAIIPRYVIEPLDYLKIEGLHKIAFPMTCFCDIPLSKVGSHMSRYGRYGLALDKQAIISKFKVQPIHYINPESPLAGDFKSAFSDYYNAGKKVHEEDKILLNYLMSAMMYMKPISGIEKVEGEERPYIFQDECEWRYIPTEDFPSNLKLMLSGNMATENAKNYYSKALQSHKETWIKFDWGDMEGLNYSLLYKAYSAKGRNPAVDPKTMFKILTYAYSQNIYS
ncbi:MAG: hypothetical protein K2P38_02975, partial [Lachnospiraceae bacterium]|nr:hypothetical protein [Lachnospiraceae bacterium]